MLIEQEKVFKPVTITLQSPREVQAFVSLVDKVNTHLADQLLSFYDNERKFLSDLSNLITTGNLQYKGE